jgi:hypothetical protein
MISVKKDFNDIPKNFKEKCSEIKTIENYFYFYSLANIYVIQKKEMSV